MCRVFLKVIDFEVCRHQAGKMQGGVGLGLGEEREMEVRRGT